MITDFDEIRPDDRLIPQKQLYGRYYYFLVLECDPFWMVFKSRDGSLYWNCFGDNPLVYRTIEAAELAIAAIDIMEINNGPSD